MLRCASRGFEDVFGVSQIDELTFRE